jgi:hypothetical protein
MRYIVTFILMLIVAGTPVWARNLPADGIQADLRALEYPYVKLAGQQLRLAPGARIFDGANRIVQPNVLPPSAKAMFKLDLRGNVQDIWLLTAEEIAMLRNKKKSQ